MNVSISGRHVEVTDAMREHVESGLLKIKQHFDRVIDVKVVLSVEKRRHLAEINLHAHGLQINAKEESDDMYASIDSALQKIERQVTKHKERIQRHQPRAQRETLEAEHEAVKIADGEDGEASGGDGTDTRQVLHREKVLLKALSVEEAAFQLDLLEDSFLMFSNAETQQVNVVYSRDDGTYGLIEPQF
ncbi:MAG: ribosome-associated translation inhibitor RaiA [Candidatus Hydrogenedentes bacterium]|nr:ribosome-associated translation inhibitor RaiA [Candidatus Hydrogenedentota bacterium]